MASKGKGIKCMVQSVDCILALNIGPETTGEQLLNMIFRQLKICEKHWFGLKYTDVKDNVRWLEPKKKVNLKEVKMCPETNTHYRFTIHFYPECLKIELVQDIVKIFFFKSEFLRLLTDVNVDILPEHRVLNAVAYACLLAHENPSVDPKSVIDKKFEKIFPAHFTSKYDLSKSDLIEAVEPLIELAKNQHYTEPLQQALDCMEQSPMYGISYFDIKNKNNTELLMGVDSLGLTIYKTDNRVNPKIAFSWTEIHSVSYSGKTFVIKPLDKNDPPLVIYSRSTRQNDEILTLIIGNHGNYLRRRQNDPQINMELKEAKKAQESEEMEKKLFKETRDKQIKYENSMKEAIASGGGDTKAKEKVEKDFEESRKVMNDQIKELQKLAEEEKQKRSQAEKDAAELKKAAEDMEKKLLNEKKTNESIALIEAERISQEESRKREIEELNKKLKEMELNHKKQLEELNELKNKPAVSTTTVEVKAAKCVSYEDENKKKNEVMRQNLKNVGTLMKSHQKKKDAQTSQIEEFSNDGKSKFETLKMLRKNNTRARIDEFESMF